MRLEAVQPVAPTEGTLAVARGPALAAALVGFAPVVGLAGAQGGFFPSSWGWATLPLLWVVALALALRQQVRLSGAERLFIGLIAALAAWILISATWSVATAASILEAERALVYVAGVAAVLVVCRSRLVYELLGGVLAAIGGITAFSLATRLAPDRVGVFDSTTVYRLAQPIGYWNGLAVFTAMGALLALGFASRARTLVTRAACAALLVVLLPTFYFTFGRGAWIALAVGLVAFVAVDPRRLQLLAVSFAVGVAPALAVLLASRRPGLTSANPALSTATHDGHRFAGVVLLLMLVNVGVMVALAQIERRVDPALTVRRVVGVAVVAVVVAGVAFVFVRYGGPATLARKGYDAFKAPPPHATSDLNRRLLSFSGNGRADLWRLAWDDARAHPALGAGAGGYERYFLAHQPADVSRVRDAHGLYVETLAELGPFGLALLVGALIVPLAVLGRARRHPIVPAAAGAYVAYLVHTGVDWDWELPAVTLAGLFAGAAVLIASRPLFRSKRVRPAVAWAGVAIAVVASFGAAVGLMGNMALSRSNSARVDRDWTRAAANARIANSWMPWSPTPWVALGRAQLGADLPRDARASFRKAISIDDGDWELWYRLASASSGKARRGALEQAARLYPRAEFLRTRPGAGAAP
jgi:O-Antigen ligase